MAFTGNESWIKAGRNGCEIHGKLSGDWWPINDVELDCEICRIDVCGKLQVVDVWDFMEIKVISDQGERIIDMDDFEEE